MKPPFHLVVALLTTESSYADEIERVSQGIPDTIQFWLTSNVQRRVRTYAIDHDIHVYDLGSPTDKTVSPDFAANHIKKHYSEVMASLTVLSFTDPKDKNEVDRVLAAENLNGTIEVSETGLAFYNPDRGDYRTKSNPKK